MEEGYQSRAISLQALRRMPYYLQYLEELLSNGVEVVAAPEVAEKLQLNEVQVRKDFAAISSAKGKPKSGFLVKDLAYNMGDCLGYHNADEAVLVGIGSLGKALLSYGGFKSYGVNIVAAFDNDERIVGSEIGGKKILHANLLSEQCRRMKIHIGIIAVPVDQAQVVCDQLIAGGIRAIWNFAPSHLSAPSDIIIQSENMAASLAVLRNHLRAKMQG